MKPTLFIDDIGSCKNKNNNKHAHTQNAKFISWKHNLGFIVDLFHDEQ
jgi:hypothetical protein